MEDYNCSACLDDIYSRTRTKCYACNEFNGIDYSVDLDDLDHIELRIPIEPSEHNYYGKILDAPLQNRGMYYFMVDEQFKKVIDKRTEEFRQQMAKILHDFKKEFYDVMARNQKVIDKIAREVSVINKIMLDKEKKEDDTFKTKQQIELEEMAIVKASLIKKGRIKEDVSFKPNNKDD